MAAVGFFGPGVGRAGNAKNWLRGCVRLLLGARACQAWDRQHQKQAGNAKNVLYRAALASFCICRKRFLLAVLHQGAAIIGYNRVLFWSTVERPAKANAYSAAVGSFWGLGWLSPEDDSLWGIEG